MTFEEWWNSFEQDGYQDSCMTDFKIAQEAWEAAWDQQQRVIDEMHLAFRDRVLVPKEPTTAMEEAFLDIYERRGWFMRGYKNMIQAAQEEE